ncbi:MAG: LUD domain-containing protein [Myxococcales bacterium]|nr:LUD domain-containing protein [Myxococcales bacterium]
MTAGNLRRRARAAVADRGLGDKVHRATLRTVEKRAHLVAGIPDWEELRRRARALRLEALDRHDELLATFRRTLEARGATVTLAGTPEEAAALVARLAREAGRRAVKSKSMTSEEIGLNAALEAAGLEVTETDLGEWIVQLAGQPPSHITAPAIHLGVEDVARLLRDRAGVELPAWVERDGTAPPAEREALARELSLAARRILRERFLAAEVGITGANFLVAESGTIVLVENEGNIRLTTCLPRRHVVLAGIDKLIARDEDLGVLLRLLPVSATAQRQSGYVSLLADRHPDLHVVLLDNGRRRLMDDPEQRDLLACIRCGACLNACPVYRCIGGHAYGGAYPGPLGAALLPQLGGGGRFSDLPFASSLCGACTDACPAGIPLHERLLQLRARLVRAGAARELGTTLRAATRAMHDPRRLRRALRLYRLGRPLLGLLPLARRWSRSRAFPPAPRRTFHDEWADARGRSHGNTPPSPPRTPAHDPAPPPAPGASPQQHSSPPSPSNRDVPAHDPAPPSAPGPSPQDLDLFALRFRELGPAGETEFHRFARAPDARAFLRDLFAGIPADEVVRPEAPHPRREVRFGVTGADALIAETGTVALSLADRAAALASLLVDTHVVLAHPSLVLPDLATYHARRAARPAAPGGRLDILVTGPSRTADIEKTLVIPAHGPRRMIVVLCDEPLDPAT